MHRSGFRELMENKKKGVSLAVVLCVSAFFVAFAAAILYTSGLLTSRSSQRLQEERCYQLARSYTEVLNAELQKYDQKNDPQAADSFYAFANRFLDDAGYQDYNKDIPESTSYQFVVSNTDLGDLSKDTVAEGYGNIRVTLRKEANTEESGSLNGGTIPVASTGNYNSEIEAAQNLTIREYILVTDVTVYVGKLSYTYSSEYTREEKYAVEFSHKDTSIVWDGSRWHIGNSAGELYEPFDVDKDTPIRYTYRQSETTSCKFVENNYTDGGTQNGN